MKQPAMTLTLRMPLKLLNKANRAARAADQTLAEFLRQAILTRLDEAPKVPPTVVDKRRALAAAFEDSVTWPGLQARLRKLGYVLRSPKEREGSTARAPLVLCTWPIEKPLVPLARLGLTREDLTLKFASQFPAARPPRKNSAQKEQRAA
ncbi:hypothetical protein [Vannielia sp.]|uniref:hypothetical protein n=1 Tax=Vannielia sp. TaxID=2813045 RepID=UPI002617E8F1|nr:hypothetical protein [Vannielia sp.]MDF1872358.1 hypothetical protein [Vannielia sp.]